MSPNLGLKGLKGVPWHTENLEEDMTELKLVRGAAGWLRLVSMLVLASVLMGALLLSNALRAVSNDPGSQDIDYAVSLSGVRNATTANNDYLEVPSNSQFNRGSNPSMIIEAWVMPTALSDQGVVFGRQHSFNLRASTNGWIFSTGT